MSQNPFPVAKIQSILEIFKYFEYFLFLWTIIWLVSEIWPKIVSLSTQVEEELAYFLGISLNSL